MPKLGRSYRFLRSAIAFAVVSGCVSALAQDADLRTAPGALSVFDIPGIVAGQRMVAALVQAEDFAGAEKGLNTLIEKYPSLAVLPLQLAILQLRKNRKDEAIESLGRAVETGLPRAMLEAAPALAALRNDPSFQELLSKAAGREPSQVNPKSLPAIRPTRVKSDNALVSTENTAWDPSVGMFRTLFDFSEAISRAPLMGDADSSDKVRGNAWFARAADRLNQWLRDGTAAGSYGDLYDNRDGGHSMLSPQIFPQLARVQYSDEVRRVGLDRGFNHYFLFNAVTIGNASLAVTSGPMWRSLPREALTDPLQVNSLFQQYIANQIYVYPAHKDYGSAEGDLITANTPYMLISVGSSGSDQPLLKAVEAISSAFQPEVKAFLSKRGLIAPTVQWIFRRGQLGIDSDEDYLSGRAHPSAFNSKRINLLDMVERAHNLEAGDVPPMVRLRVEEESHGEAGMDIMLPNSGETLFDTPAAIARIVRSTAFAKRLVVDASQTVDANNRALSFRWAVLRGDKNKITVRPLNDHGSVAEIVIPWTAGARDKGGENIGGDRVEIGVFANNGKHWSSPAFVSIIFPANENRTYRSDEKIAEIDYADPHNRMRYVDPVLFPLREWRDSYSYDNSGRLLGWTRSRSDKVARFARDGTLVIETDEIGRPLKTEQVRYNLRRRVDGRVEVIEVPTGNFVTYSYKDADDMLGTTVQSSGG